MTTGREERVEWHEKRASEAHDGRRRESRTRCSHTDPRHTSNPRRLTPASHSAPTLALAVLFIDDVRSSFPAADYFFPLRSFSSASSSARLLLFLRANLRFRRNLRSTWRCRQASATIKRPVTTHPSHALSPHALRLVNPVPVVLSVWFSTKSGATPALTTHSGYAPYGSWTSPSHLTLLDRRTRRRD